jgi:hypothetical protein
MSKLLQRLMDPSRSGVYRTRALDDLLEVVAQGDFDCVRIPLRDAESKDAMLKAIADALGFPRWFGGNWDALEDCLADLSWRAPKPRVLVFEAQTVNDDFGVLVDILAASAEYWSERGKPFFAVFIDPRNALPLADLYRERRT